MTEQIVEILKELEIQTENNENEFANFFLENGYCVLPQSDFILNNLEKFRKIIDDLMTKEDWRGGWEGKEQYMKFNKKFNKGANRLANLFNKDKLFLKLITEKNLLTVLAEIFQNDLKFGALDMREPLQGTGWQELHIDWLPRKNYDDPIENVICFIFLDDTNVENGAMRIVPKTHKKIGWIDDYQKDKSSHPEEITVDVKKGSIFLMNANLWHSGTTNKNGLRRRVLYLDVRRRSIPQLLNQRIYLDENTQNTLSETEKFLLGVAKNDEIFDERVFAVGDYYRKHFKTDVVVREQE